MLTFFHVFCLNKLYLLYYWLFGIRHIALPHRAISPIVVNTETTMEEYPQASPPHPQTRVGQAAMDELNFDVSERNTIRWNSN